MTAVISSQLESYSFTGQRPGPHLWVSGQVHGNEPAGSLAIDRVRREIYDGTISLERGRLLLVPRINKIAIAANQRFVAENLNRNFVSSWGQPASEEGRIRSAAVQAVGQFCSIAADELTDVLPLRYVLDLHSFHTPGLPHAWIYTSPHKPFTQSDDYRFAAASDVPRLLCGWAEAYRATSDRAELAAAGFDDPKLDLNPLQQAVTVRKLSKLATTLGQFASGRGAVATTVECGEHNDPQAVTFAYQAVRHALHFLGIAAYNTVKSETVQQPDTLTVTRVIFRLEGDKLSRPFNDLEPLRTGEPVVTGGRQITAPDNALILFSNRTAKVGTELCYFATPSAPG